MKLLILFILGFLLGRCETFLKPRIKIHIKSDNKVCPVCHNLNTKPLIRNSQNWYCLDCNAVWIEGDKK